MNMKILLPILLTAMLVLVVQGVSAAISFTDCTDNSTIDISVDLDDDNIKPGQDIKVAITFENGDNDYDVEDIDYEVYFEPSLEDDDGDNIEEDDSIDVDSDEEEEVEYSWTPAQDFDDGDSYTLIVKAKSTNFEGNSSAVLCAYNDDGNIDFEKKKYELDIYKVSATPSIVECSRNINIKTAVRNIGEKDVDDAVLTISQTELGIEKIINLDDLSNDPDDDDNSIEKTNSFAIPESAAPGTYTVSLNIEYANKYTEFSTVDVEVKKCAIVEEEEEEEETPETTVVVQPTATTPITTAPTTTGAATIIPPLTIEEEKPQFFNSLIIGIIALEVIIVIVGVALIIKWAKRS